MFEKISKRGMAFDHALDPHAVVETFRHSQVVVKVAHDAMQAGRKLRAQPSGEEHTHGVPPRVKRSCSASKYSIYARIRLQ
jgi:hypothetical protein